MQRGFHGSVSTVFGAAVTAGRLLGLPADRMAQAIALAATSIGGMAIAADTSCAREYHAGLAAASGIQAALAARRGFDSMMVLEGGVHGWLEPHELAAMSAEVGVTPTYVAANLKW